MLWVIIIMAMIIAGVITRVIIVASVEVVIVQTICILSVLSHGFGVTVLCEVDGQPMDDVAGGVKVRRWAPENRVSSKVDVAAVRSVDIIVAAVRRLSRRTDGC